MNSDCVVGRVEPGTKVPCELTTAPYLGHANFFLTYPESIPLGLPGSIPAIKTVGVRHHQNCKEGGSQLLSGGDSLTAEMYLCYYVVHLISCAGIPYWMVFECTLNF